MEAERKRGRKAKKSKKDEKEKRREERREKSGLQPRREVYPRYSFPTLLPRCNPVARFLVHLSSRCTPHPVPTMFYLAGTYIFRPAEIRRLSERKCLERTSEIGRESAGKQEGEKKRGAQERKGKKKRIQQRRTRPNG